MTTRAYDTCDVRSSTKRIIDVLRLIDRSITDIVVTSVDKTRIKTKLQAELGLQFDNDVDQSVYSIIVGHAMACEQMGPGSLSRFFELLSRSVSSVAGSSTMAVPATVSVCQPWAATGADVKRLAASRAEIAGARVVAMVTAVLELAGFAGKVVVEKTGSLVPSVELVRGYTFECRSPLGIDVTFDDARCFCVDGYIEEVSEVHHLLQEASEGRVPVVLFVRGMADDVLSTLRLNYDRGSLRVVPVVASFDLEGMNTLADVATVLGCDVVSHLKGELISSIRLASAPVADRVSLFRGKVVITKKSTWREVGTHVARLREKRDAEPIEDVAALLSKRIRSLTPHHVVVRLPDDASYVVASQAFDNALRTVRSAIDAGLEADGAPTSSRIAAELYARRCAETLNQLGAVVTCSTSPRQPGPAGPS